MGLLLLLLSSLVAPAQAANRAIMEGIAASSNTIFIDTVTVRVGVGTNAPATKLTVQSTTTGSGVNIGSFLTTGDGGQGLYLGMDTTNKKAYLRLNTDTTYGFQLQGPSGTDKYFTVLPNLNFGINTTNPAANLEVKSTASPTGYAFLVSSQTASTRLMSVDGSGNGYVAGSFTAASFSSPGTPTLSSTQTWSGANTFLSTSTFGVSPGTGTHNTAVYTSTANYSAVARGVPTRVIYSSFTAVSEIVLSGLISTYTHTVKFSALQNTSNGTWNMTLDGSTATYRWANTRGLSDSTGETQGSSSDTECQITGTSAVRATDPGSVTMILTLAAGDPNADKILASWIGSTVLSDNNFMSIRGGCLHDPAGSGDRRTAVRLFPSAGTVTGTIQVFAEAE